MRRSKGFTLLEMLVVIAIIIMLASTAVVLMNSFFRGQGVRQGAMLVMQAIAQAKQTASETLHTSHLVLSPPALGTGDPNPAGWMEIHVDTPDVTTGSYDGKYGVNGVSGNQILDTIDHDKVTRQIDLPKFVVFDPGAGTALAWITFQPSGYITLYNSSGTAFNEIQASVFDAVMNGSAPNAVGDIIIRMYGKPYRMCMDLDRASGKVRRHFFLAE